jgi:DNA-binding GntR family transcriptional regulator
LCVFWLDTNCTCDVYRLYTGVVPVIRVNEPKRDNQTPILMSENNIYQELKNQIILLERKPGAVIREKEIMEVFGVSRTPVRETLMRLEMDGLVRIIPNVGTFVAEVSFQQLKDVFEIRSHLVRLAGRLAAERITEEELTAIYERIDGMKSAQDFITLMRLDGEIHVIIRKATKNEVLIKVLAGLHDQAVRIWTYSGAEGGYWDDLEKEFVNIASALEQRDGELSARLLEEHTKRFVEHVRSQLTF